MSLGPAKRMAYHTVTGLAVCLLAVASKTTLCAGTMTEWKGDEGNWEDAAMWGGTLPSRTTEAQINGTQEKSGTVTLARAAVLVSHLSVAEGGNSLASLVHISGLFVPGLTGRVLDWLTPRLEAGRKNNV